MDLSTTYMGMSLRSPLVPSASPLSESIDDICRMAEAGAAAIVMHSLFEEQLQSDRDQLHHHLHYGTESFAEALTYFPGLSSFQVGPEDYLNHIHQAKAQTDIPIIASLNGCSVGGWTQFAIQIEQAGADALELNIYAVPTDPHQSAQDIEQMVLEILQSVKARVTIPVAVKLSPFFTNLAAMAHQLDQAGADALVLFNRFYQPDINLETLEVEPNVLLSTPHAMRLPLRWIAILYGHLHCNLAATSGIHCGRDVVKLLMAGADVTMLCSVLLRHGIKQIQEIEQELRQWMLEHEYESVRQLQGSMSQRHCPNPSAYERAQYMRSLQTYRPEWARTYRPSRYFG